MKRNEDSSKWKDIPYSWIRRINIVKVFVIRKTFYIFNPVSIKIPMAFLHRNNKTILKLYETTKRLQVAKVILQKNKAKGIIPSDFKLYYARLR